MPSDDLLRELEPLTHADRVRRVVDLGRRAAADPAGDAAAVLAAWEAGGWYGRWLALHACYGSRDGAHVLRALADPSRSVRALAVSLVPLVCDDEQARAALAAVPRDRRRRLVGALRRRRRFGPLDGHFAALAARSDADLPRLLPYGSDGFVGRHLDAVLDRADAVAWGRLARLHPDRAAAGLVALAETGERSEEGLALVAGAALAPLSARRPDTALGVATALARRLPLARLDLQPLADRRPAEVADLLLAGTDRPLVVLWHRADRLGLARLLALADRHPSVLGYPGSWLDLLPPAERGALFAARAGAWRGGDGILAESVVAVLPRAEREAEARRHLALPALAGDDLRRLKYAAFLPWAEARAAVADALGSPRAEARSVAVRALADAVRYDRTRLPDLLALLEARRREQDPVRLTALQSLASSPPGMWRAEHLDGLGRVLRAALDAADLSPSSAEALALLVVKLLPFHPDRAATWLATVVRERADLPIADIGARLSARDVARLAPALLPVFAGWSGPTRHDRLLAAGLSFGRRLSVFGGLVALLERALAETRDAGVARQVLHLLRERRPDRLAALAPALLAEDPSWLRQEVVLGYLHRRRQDLLTPFLPAPRTPGRFDAGRARIVLPLHDGFARWTAAQQATYARTLGELTGDPAKDPNNALYAIARLAAIPAVAPDVLTRLAAADSPAPAVRDVALRALGRLDGPEGVPTLVASLADDRAGVAIYALRGAILALPPAEALRRLRAAPTGRVTVAKEIVRLTGEVRSEEAYADLLALDRRELHRDVRVALLRALWGWAERDETWPIFEAAVAAPDPALVDGVVLLPADGLSARARERLTGLVAALLRHPDPGVRFNTLVRLRRAPVEDPGRALIPALLAALASPVPLERPAAAAALFGTYLGEAAVVGEAVARLGPDRRALMAVADAIRAALSWRGDRALPATRAVLAALASDPATVALRCDLAAHALPADELAAHLAEVAAADEFHADALARVVAAVGARDSTQYYLLDDLLPRFHAAGTRRGRQAWRWRRPYHDFGRPAARERFGTEDLGRLEAALRGSPDPRLRRVALAAFETGAASGGWDDGRRARLADYRADPAPLVAGAAQFLLPPEEGE